MKYHSVPIATQTRYPFQRNNDHLSNTIHQIDMSGKQIEKISDKTCTSHQVITSASHHLMTSKSMDEDQQPAENILDFQHTI